MKKNLLFLSLCLAVVSTNAFWKSFEDAQQEKIHNEYVNKFNACHPTCNLKNNLLLYTIFDSLFLLKKDAALEKEFYEWLLQNKIDEKTFLSFESLYRKDFPKNTQAERYYMFLSIKKGFFWQVVQQHNLLIANDPDLKPLKLPRTMNDIRNDPFFNPHE